MRHSHNALDATRLCNFNKVSFTLSKQILKTLENLIKTLLNPLIGTEDVLGACRNNPGRPSLRGGRGAVGLGPLGSLQGSGACALSYFLKLVDLHHPSLPRSLGGRGRRDATCGRRRRKMISEIRSFSFRVALGTNRRPTPPRGRSSGSFRRVP